MRRAVVAAILGSLAAGSAAAVERGCPAVSSPGIASLWSDAVDHGTVGGLNVWSRQGRILIESPDGKFLLVGRLFGERGQDIGAALTGGAPVALTSMFNGAASPDVASLQEMQARLAALAGRGEPAPRTGSNGFEQHDTEAILNRLESEGYGFTLGTGDNEIVAILDPECPYCIDAVNLVRPAIEAGQLKVKVLLVAVIASSSPMVVASVLTSADPAAAFLAHVESKASRRDSDLAPVDLARLPNNITDGVNRNFQLLRDFDLRTVPVFAWRQPDGTARLHEGVPGSLGLFGIGLAAQREPSRTQ